METKPVALRPACSDDLWVFERQGTDPDAGGPFNWSGFKGVTSIKNQFDENGLIGPDGLHPTAEGYARMTQIFFEAIRANFEAPAASVRATASTQP